MPMIDLSTRSNKTEIIAQTRVIAMLQQRLTGVITWPWLPAMLVSLAVLSAMLLPLNLLTGQRFHQDEALYATWALEISSGHNPLLRHVPVDKPPLFLYLTAGAMWLLGATETVARLPSVLSTALTVGLTFWLGRKLYDHGVGILAAWLVALSPLTISFAPTAFTDPMLVMWVLAACLAAALGRAGLAGMGLGLAVATKQQGLFFVPLVLGLWVCNQATGIQMPYRLAETGPNIQYLIRKFSPRANPNLPATPIRTHLLRLLPEIARMGASLAAIVLLTLIWDLARLQFPGYWRLSLINYGHPTTGAISFGERLHGFVDLLYYSTGSSILNTIFGVGMLLLLLYGTWRVATMQKRRSDHGQRLYNNYRHFVRRTSLDGDGYLAIRSESLPQNDAPLRTRNEPRTDISVDRQLRQTVWTGPTLFLAGVRPSLYQIFEPSSTPSPPPGELRQIQTDWLLWIFTLLYLSGHALLSFQVWDRYLLGLIPILALLLARVLLLPWSILKNHWLKHRSVWRPLAGMATGLALSLSLALTLAQPIQNAANARYPLGSDSSALQGIDQIVAYLQGHAGANTTLYHRWLGTHWSSPAMLAAKAQPGHLIAFPSWHSDTEVRLALTEAGLQLKELARAHTQAGSPSIILYRIENVSQPGR
jgi:hypothetical protein